MSDTRFTRFLDWLHRILRRCDICHWRMSDWWYGPGNGEACDTCVPRGCSCTVEPLDGNYENLDPANWEKAKDPQGREVPCCEWFRYDSPPLLAWLRK